MPTPSAMPSGILLFDKPEGWTSHDVVARTRRVFGTRKVGHAGTLDPMATGLLMLGVNRATRLLTYLVGLDKTYTATIRLGAATITDDREGEVTATASPRTLAGVTDGLVRAAIAEHLTGDILQRPSSVSAIKRDGVRAYARVRAGERVELEARPVRVSAFEVGGVARSPEGFVDVEATVSCSSGTYVRALARDLGEILGVGGHLTALRRVRVGPFAVADAASMGDFERALDGSDAHGRKETPTLLGMGEVAARLFPARRVSERESVEIRQGKRIAPTGADGTVAAIDGDGGLVALLADRPGGFAKSVLVIPQEDA